MKKHRARKRFGQNFLSDQGVIHRILASIAPKDEDFLLEIGPGQGALTLPMLSQIKQLTAVEIDRDLIPYLQQKSTGLGQLDLIEADALAFDFSSLVQDKPLRIYGNLPYNISSPLLFHLLTLVDKIEDMHFMLQKEVVERLAAEPGCKSYGRLSVIMQYFCEVENLFTVPPTAFEPQPKVDSAIVRLTPYKINPYSNVPMETLQSVLRLAFAQRRKTLKNNLKTLISAEELAVLGIDASQRPERLSVEDYVKISLGMA